MNTSLTCPKFTLFFWSIEETLCGYMSFYLAIISIYKIAHAPSVKVMIFSVRYYEKNNCFSHLDWLYILLVFQWKKQHSTPAMVAEYGYTSVCLPRLALKHVILFLQLDLLWKTNKYRETILKLRPSRWDPFKEGHSLGLPTPGPFTDQSVLNN